ncbi:energy transducer TonB [Pseudotenacibaculum haliotis]|uniref:Energy transducer TonB n=1 Tax=Pseudotenacibaculum haliotis TaxID=1862138 RepID=A0ABW5LR27_9FLAO
MIPHKKNPRKQLEKYSLIFMQISLILVLFVTHLLIENIIAEKVTKPHPPLPDDIFTMHPEPFDFVKYKEPPKKVAQAPVHQPKPLDKIKKGDPPKKALPVLEPTIQPTPVTGSSKKEEKKAVKEEPKPINKIHSYKMVVPLFKGCKDVSLEENRACFERKMKKFVNKKFDTGLGEELGLLPGNYKIFAQFIIDEQGNVVDIKVRAPHQKLHKEVQRMVGKLPQFTPGKVGDKNVQVRYLLPISFKVD